MATSRIKISGKYWPSGHYISEQDILADSWIFFLKKTLARTFKLYVLICTMTKS